MALLLLRVLRQFSRATHRFLSRLHRNAGRALHAFLKRADFPIAEKENTPAQGSAGVFMEVIVNLDATDRPKTGDAALGNHGDMWVIVSTTMTLL